MELEAFYRCKKCGDQHSIIVQNRKDAQLYVEQRATKHCMKVRCYGDLELVRVE